MHYTKDTFKNQESARQHGLEHTRKDRELHQVVCKYLGLKYS